MNCPFAFTKKLLSCPVAVGAGIFGISLLSLASAYTAQYGFGLQPCILCLYQRAPFAIAAILGIVCAAFGKYGRRTAASLSAAASGVVFLTGSIIAAYHSGVERHWWKSMFESCAGLSVEGDAGSLLARIEQASIARCDEIPWADPILGLSMANYNAAMSFGLFAICLAAAWLIRRGGGKKCCAAEGGTTPPARSEPS